MARTPEQKAARKAEYAARKAAQRRANQLEHRKGLDELRRARKELQRRIYDQIAQENGLPSGEILATTLTEISDTIRTGGRFDWDGKAGGIARGLEEIAARGLARLRDPALARLVPEPSAKVTQLALEALLARATPVGQPLNAAGPLRVEILLAAPPVSAAEPARALPPAAGPAPGAAGTAGAAAGLLPTGRVRVHLTRDQRDDARDGGLRGAR
jgi:hypothetical protein